MSTMISETRPLGLIHWISLDGIGSLHYRQGEVPTLTVGAEPDAMALIITEVRDGTLHIETRFKSTKAIAYKSPPVYTISTPTLTELTLRGAGRAQIESLTDRRLELMLDGAGQIKLDKVVLESFRLEVKGAGTVTAVGSALVQDIILQGTGNFSGGALAGEDVQVLIPGAGRAKVNASKTLRVEIGGVGSVSYIGNPSVEKKMGGLGIIKQDR